MASRHGKVLALLAVGIARCSANDADLRNAIEELQKLATLQQDRIQNLEGDLIADPRQLQGFSGGDQEVTRGSGDGAVTTTTKDVPSIFGPYKPGKISYTARESLKTALTEVWLVICGALVMFMQAGFAMVEAGSCRAKNVQNVLLKNLCDVVIGTFGWWILGWSLAFTGLDTDGFKESAFVGSSEFVSSGFITTKDDGQQEPSTKMATWFFQWAFCATAATIISGGVAERVNFGGYVFVSIMMTSFIYPCVVGASWGMGFLSVEFMNDSGYIDFAGSGIVHLTGGIGALVGAVMVGPRRGRFDKTWSLKDRAFKAVTERPEFAPHSLPLVVLGTFILWFGWYGFNCGSTLGQGTVTDGMLAAQVAMNTTMGASAGGLTVFLLRYAMFKKYDVGGFCNGILAGLVSITAGCSNVESGSALCIGIIGGFVYQFASSLLKILMIDDVVDAFPVHGAAGAWGVMAAALFDWGFGFYQVSGWSGFKCIKNHRTKQCKGLVDGMGKDVVASNMIEIIFIVVWVGGLSLLVFLPLKLTHHLRAKDEVQEAGFDNAKHSPSKAYDLQAVGVSGGNAV